MFLSKPFIVISTFSKVPILRTFWHFESLFGPYLYFRVPTFTISVSFTQRMSIQSVCTYTTMSYLYMFVNIDFYLFLCINFHTSPFWVLILATSGPYWVLISQKNGSLSQSLGVLTSFGGSGQGRLAVREVWFI